VGVAGFVGVVAIGAEDALLDELDVLAGAVD
jgi:hypothetical protein